LRREMGLVRTTVPERWPSGLRRTLGKRVYVQAYRGFESHSLRQPELLIYNNLLTSGAGFELVA
jgi:hypothetical protein